MDRVLIGKNIKAERERQGLKKTALANMAGLTNQQVFHYEQGQRPLREDELVRLSVALDVTLDWLCGLVEDKTIKIEVPNCYRIGRRATLTHHYVMLTPV